MDFKTGMLAMVVGIAIVGTMMTLMIQSGASVTVGTAICEQYDDCFIELFIIGKISIPGGVNCEIQDLQGNVVACADRVCAGNIRDVWCPEIKKCADNTPSRVCSTAIWWNCC